MLYPSSFPIDPVLPDLKEAIRAHPAVILQAQRPDQAGWRWRVFRIAAVTISKRESRFPIVTVNQLPLVKRTVFAEKSLGEVKALSLSNFDVETGTEIGVLGRSGLALLQPETYRVKSLAAFIQDKCDRCVQMYPYLVSDPITEFHEPGR